MGSPKSAGAAVSTIPGAAGWLVPAALLGIYALIALPVGFKLGLIHVEVIKSWPAVAKIVAGSFLMPGVSVAEHPGCARKPK